MQKHRSRRSRAGGSLRQELLALYQRSQPAYGADADASLVRLRQALQAERDSGVDGQLLGMAAAQCARIGEAKPVGLLLAFAAPRLDSCGSRAVVELAQAAHKLSCMEPGFLRATMTYFASEGVSFHSLRDAAMAATVLLQSVRGDSMVNHEGALRGIAEAVRPLFDSSPMQSKSAAQAVRDCVELCHALAHSLCQVSLGSAELAAVEAALAGALRQVRRELHAGCARDAAMLAGAAAAAWPQMPGLQDSLLWPCLTDVAQLARFRGADFSLQDLCMVAAAFAKVAKSDEIFASVLEIRVVHALDSVCNRDLSFLLWAAACVPGWAVTTFADAALDQILHRPKALLSAKDLCTLVQSLVKIRESNPKAQEVLRAVAEEGLSRDGSQFSSEDRSCMLWALLRATQAGEGGGCETPEKRSPQSSQDQQGSGGSSGDEEKQDTAARAGRPQPSSKARQRRGGKNAAGREKQQRRDEEAAQGDGAARADDEAPAGSSFVAKREKKDRFCPPCSPRWTPEQVPRSMICLADSLCFPPGLGKTQACNQTNPWVHGGNLPSTSQDSETHCMASETSMPSETPTPFLDSLARGSSHESNASSSHECHGHSHECHGHGHGQGHGQGQGSQHHDHDHSCHGHEDKQQHTSKTACEDDDCCPYFTRSSSTGGSDLEVRLNAHCSFSGHCVKLKNTFIHIPCNSFSDSEEDGDCAVCALTRVRSRSCDDVGHGRRSSSPSNDSDAYNGSGPRASLL
eukprot:TRINITY_DN14247_c0_g1_i1.p1 TRINITY_DN14247_c0_g1~~TRINITY_DN14247_c0_g1_i1.p1  ORF type:complete len:744 (-),score=149.99 TRINITY_DN14247_c0_g1_i1:18-2249(-)